MYVQKQIKEKRLKSFFFSPYNYLQTISFFVVSSHFSRGVWWMNDLSLYRIIFLVFCFSWTKIGAEKLSNDTEV